MPHIDRHPPGDFCWIELATTDQSAAKRFYGSLFGWAVTDYPMGPDDVYTIFKLENQDAAAAYTIRPEQRSQGVPPHWMLYVAADNADEAAARAAQLGGKVLSPAFDVMGNGRMAVIQDPTGAVFCVWQPKSHIGTRIAGVDGTLCWADLSTPDAARAKRFYGNLFGWQIIPGKGKPEDGYLHIKNGEQFIGGIPPAAHRDSHSPPHWLSYFTVSDVDAAAEQGRALGATVHLPPMTIENNLRMAVLADPQGAVFAIFKELPRS